ncbi:hypothetical protein OGAPHI_002264 [Ogataea philodendri]|uniref:Uncharacterized protein n=1 Tax=Ogataea philodendri TaxID=1378263 RepID=A0A9P8T7T4_9ASCO|nr:uncharacterized protein OGAPHI_002264 [Ogataea philodendri]KAH3668510.1 hypothetical protein OGAPHI_002264 [Ogataea philodendri]
MLLTRLTITGTDDAYRTLSVLDVCAWTEITCRFEDSGTLMYSVAIWTEGACKLRDAGLWFTSRFGSIIMIDAPLKVNRHSSNFNFDWIEEKNVADSSVGRGCTT